jgi:hypothetical protein
MATLEQRKSYFVSKDFKGVNVTNNRTAIGEGEFAWLENTQPIGFGNIRIINAPSNVAGITFANTVSYMASANIQNTEFLFAFQEDGSAQYVNIETDTLGNLAPSRRFPTLMCRSCSGRMSASLSLTPTTGTKHGMARILSI